MTSADVTALAAAKSRIPSALHQARRAQKASSAAMVPPPPERRAARPLPPASATVPSVLPIVDHGALLLHPFLVAFQGDRHRAEDGESAVSDTSEWSTVSASASCSDAGAAAARASASRDEPLLLHALNHLATLISALKPVPLRFMLLPASLGASDPAHSQWLEAAAAVRSLDWCSELELLHLLSLRRRLHVPHIAALFTSADPALARCMRWIGCSSRASDSSFRVYRCGEAGPREAQGWNLAQSAYCFPAEYSLRMSWIPAALRAVASEPGEDVNDMGWRVTSAQDFFGPHFVVVLSNLDALVPADVPGFDALDLVAAAINGLSPAPRAVVFTGRLLPTSSTSAVVDVDRLRRVLSRFCASLAHEATTVVLATQEHSWISASLLGNGLSERILCRVETTCGAWFSGVRLLMCDADVALRASDLHVEGGGDVGTLPRLPSTALDSDALWLLDALEHARSGAHHAVVLLRDSMQESGQLRTCADVSDGALAQLLCDSNVRCVVESQLSSRGTLSELVVPALATASASDSHSSIKCRSIHADMAIRAQGRASFSDNPSLSSPVSDSALPAQDRDSAPVEHHHRTDRGASDTDLRVLRLSFPPPSIYQHVRASESAMTSGATTIRTQRPSAVPLERKPPVRVPVSEREGPTEHSPSSLSLRLALEARDSESASGSTNMTHVGHGHAVVAGTGLGAASGMIDTVPVDSSTVPVTRTTGSLSHGGIPPPALDSDSDEPSPLLQSTTGVTVSLHILKVFRHDIVQGTLQVRVSQVSARDPAAATTGPAQPAAPALHENEPERHWAAEHVSVFSGDEIAAEVAAASSGSAGSQTTH